MYSIKNGCLEDIVMIRIILKIVFQTYHVDKINKRGYIYNSQGLCI